MYRPVNHGYIETVIGPMYSGKSEELYHTQSHHHYADDEESAGLHHAEENGTGETSDGYQWCEHGRRRLLLP